MKKIIMLFTYLSVFSVLSAGCAAGERRTETDRIRSENPVIQKQTENTAAEESEGSAGVGISAADEPTVSSEEKTVAYEGTIPFHYIAAAKDGLFLSARDQGEGSFLLRMKTGEGGAEKLPVKAPEGMEFGHLAVDERNRLYAVVISKGSSVNCEIWRMKEDGTREAGFDISQYMEREDWYPWAFAVAGNGDMYLRIGGLNGILALVFDEDGNCLSKILDEEKYQLIDAMGRGRDGNIYAVLQDEEGHPLLARLDGREGAVRDIREDILPDGMGMFACVGAGTDSDLILYGPGAGIFAYDLGEKKVKRHISAAELPFPMDSGCKSTVLPDGRMLFAERGIVTKDGQILSTAEGTTFYYIPFGQ